MDLVLQLAAVALVVGLTAGASWLIRRNQGVSAFRSGRELVSQDRLQLTPQHSVHLIRFRDREILLVSHSQGCSVIEVPE